MERDQYKCITFPIPLFNHGKIKWKNNIQINVLFRTDKQISKFIIFFYIKDLSIEKEHFIDIFLINKNQHKVTINVGLIGFMYQNITFKQHKDEMYQTNLIDLISALYHLTYEKENDINEILNIQENETIQHVATFERKPNFKCKFDIKKYTKSEKEFIQMFDFQHSHLTQEEFEKIVTFILEYKQVYA